MAQERFYPLRELILARLRLFIREPHAIFWVYGFPLLLALGLGFAFRGAKPPPPHVDVQAGPDLSRANEVAEKLRHADFEVEVLPNKECEKRLSRGKTALYIVAHPSEIEYVYDPANKESVQARYWAEAVLSRGNNGLTWKDTLPTEPGSRYVHFLLPALVGTNIMGGGLFGLGFVLVDMRVRKLFKRLMATPMRHRDFLVSMVVARFVFLVPEMTSLLCVGYFVFDLPFRGSMLTLMLVILAGAAAFAGLGLLIGCRTEKTETASGLINLILLPQYVLSGVFFSSANFPDAAQPFIKALPLTQLIDALREVLLEGASLWDVAWHIGVLMLYGVITFALALRWFKWR